MILPQILGSLRLRITEEALTFKFGSRPEQIAPYSLVSASDDKVVLTIAPEGIDPGKAILLREGEENLMIDIEGSNDMSFYVWEETDSMEADDPNFAAIQPVNGEDYSTIVVEASDESIRVTDQDGETYTFDF